MKKILICALGLLVLTSCNSNTTSYAKNEEYHEMTVVDDAVSYKIYQHNKTGVYYFLSFNGSSRSVTIMLNADGTPYTGENIEN